MSYYMIKRVYSIPGFLFSAAAAFVIANALTIAASIPILFIPDASGKVDAWLKSLPIPVAALLGFFIVFTAIGAIWLYATMWIYWIAVERGTLARIVWLIIMLMGMHIGAMVHAFVVWIKDTEKITEPHRIEACPR